jgi:two-component system, LuxR family, sensor kinase FixL
LTSRRFPPLAIAAAYVVAYELVAWLTFTQQALKPAITPWNPQAGLTLAFLLLLGARWALVVPIAAALCELLLHRSSSSPVTVVATSLWIGATYAVMAIVLRQVGATGPIQTALTAAKFAATAVIGTLIASSGYVAIFVATGDVALDDALRGAARYWFADLNGILMLTPLLTYGVEWRSSLPTIRQRWREIAAQFALVLLTLVIVFYLPAPDQLRFFYFLFVPVIWIALRWRLPGAVFAVLVIHMVLIFAARAEIHTPGFIDLQILLLTLGLTALLLGAVVAERARTEEQVRERDAALAHAMRFAVAGELASALTHELKQPIAALLSYLRATEILADRTGDVDARVRETLGKSVREATRASDVLHKLRDFYRGESDVRAPVDIRALCDGVAGAFQERLRKAQATLVIQVDPGIPLVEGDETQLQIVLHNLVANAIEAVDQEPCLLRQIELHATSVSDAVILRVDDSGPGVSSDLARKLFEPFVTSKTDGMGLGLAISRSLVRSRGGELSCEPAGKLGGASFTLRLPLRVPSHPQSELIGGHD